MGKRKKGALTRQLQRERERASKLLPQPKPLWQRLLSNVYAGITVTSVLVGLVLGWLTLRPHLSIRPDVRVDERNPFTTQFVVTNEGFSTVRDVTSNCYYD